MVNVATDEVLWDWQEDIGVVKIQVMQNILGDFYSPDRSIHANWRDYSEIE